jgi:hypothetical protein
LISSDTIISASLIPDAPVLPFLFYRSYSNFLPLGYTLPASSLPLFLSSKLRFSLKGTLLRNIDASY